MSDNVLTPSVREGQPVQLITTHAFAGTREASAERLRQRWQQHEKAIPRWAKEAAREINLHSFAENELSDKTISEWADIIAQHFKHSQRKLAVIR